MPRPEQIRNPNQVKVFAGDLICPERTRIDAWWQIQLLTFTNAQGQSCQVSFEGIYQPWNQMCRTNPVVFCE